MNPDTLAADSAALASAASAAEEALQLEREALSVLKDGWSGDSASAAADFIAGHLTEGEAVVSALRRASEVLAALGESPDESESATAHAPVQSALADRPSSAFASPMPSPAPAAAPGMSWPSMPAPALPDLGGAIANLISQAADAFNFDPANDDPAAIPAEAVADVKRPAGPVIPDPGANSVAAPAQPAMPIAPVSPESDSTQPLLAAEIPPEEPASPDPPPAPAADDRTPCDIAADELPQIGQ